MCSSDIFLGLIAILFPPLAVWVKRGICSTDSLINILLCMLGFLPGLLHAWYIIAKFPETEYEYAAVPDSEQGHPGRITYYYVNHQPAPKPAPSVNRDYGTVGQEGQESGTTAGPSSSTGGVPPSYEQAVQGDHKVQK